MRIDNIVLNNFGSYEGETIFDTNSQSGKNIILGPVCFADSAGATDIAHIRRLTQLFTGTVVVLPANGTAVNGFTMDTLSFALLISAKMFPFAAGSHVAVVPMGMYTGHMGTVLADLTGDSGGCLADFLGNLGQGLPCIDASFNGSSV